MQPQEYLDAIRHLSIRTSIWCRSSKPSSEWNIGLYCMLNVQVRKSPRYTRKPSERSNHSFCMPQTLIYLHAPNAHLLSVPFDGYLPGNDEVNTSDARPYPVI